MRVGFKHGWLVCSELEPQRVCVRIAHDHCGGAKEDDADDDDGLGKW